MHRNDVFCGHFSPHSNTRKNFSHKIWTSLMSSYRRLVKNVVFFSYLLHQNDVICHQCSVTNVHNILTQVSIVHMELDYTLLFLCTTSKTRTRTRTLPKWRADSYTRYASTALSTDTRRRSGRLDLPLRAFTLPYRPRLNAEDSVNHHDDRTTARVFTITLHTQAQAQVYPKY